MAVNLPNGSVISIASTYEAAKDISAITNATEAVATLEASHGVSQGDIIEVTSGWSRLSGRILRAKTVETNDVTLEGMDTSSTTKFPAGSGTGTVREISAWTQITQVLNAQFSGGEGQFTTYSFLEDDTQRQLPTQKSPESITLQLGDDQSLPWYAVLAAADEDRLARALRVVLPTGAILYYNAIVSFRKSPSLTQNEVMALQAVFSIQAAVTRYAS